MMEKVHWLWPNLVYETTIPVEDIQAFNTNLIRASIDVMKSGTGRLIFSDENLPDDSYPEEVQIIKKAVLDSNASWLRHAGLDHVFEPDIIDSYTGIYKPELFLSPHYHDPRVLITLYYLTDEIEENDHQVSAHLIPGQSRSTKAGHTVFMDPRGNIQLRERPSIPGVMDRLEKPEIAEFCPKQGRMLTFAGHLLHWFMPTDNFRATITTGVVMKYKPDVQHDG